MVLRVLAVADYSLDLRLIAKPKPGRQVTPLGL